MLGEMQVQLCWQAFVVLVLCRKHMVLVSRCHTFVMLTCYNYPSTLRLEISSTDESCLNYFIWQNGDFLVFFFFIFFNWIFFCLKELCVIQLGLFSYWVEQRRQGKCLILFFLLPIFKVRKYLKLSGDQLDLHMCMHWGFFYF